MEEVVIMIILMTLIYKSLGMTCFSCLYLEKTTSSSAAVLEVVLVLHFFRVF